MPQATSDNNLTDSEFYFWTKLYIKNHSDKFQQSFFLSCD